MEENKPIPDQHNDKSMNGYSLQYSFDGAFVDDGLEFRCNGASAGMKNFVHDLLADISANITKHPDYPNPVISLFADSYDHKTWGETYVPKYKLIGWANDLFEIYDDDVKKLMA
jgi:hypothetical protein